jgi:hypothetical protein
MNSQINVLKCEGHNKALQRTAIPLRSIAAGELGRSATRSGEAHRRVVTFAAGGEVNESTPVVEESLAHIGASVMGRNMFGGHPGPWDAKEPWSGWWGVNPLFQHPVFVLTHYAREPLELEGGTTFTFVTDGIEAALEQARRAAGGKDVSLAG